MARSDVVCRGSYYCCTAVILMTTMFRSFLSLHQSSWLYWVAYILYQWIEHTVISYIQLNVDWNEKRNCCRYVWCSFGDGLASAAPFFYLRNSIFRCINSFETQRGVRCNNVPFLQYLPHPTRFIICLRNFGTYIILIYVPTTMRRVSTIQ